MITICYSSNPLALLVSVNYLGFAEARRVKLWHYQTWQYDRNVIQPQPALSLEIR